jgi:hypothetical protein
LAALVDLAPDPTPTVDAFFVDQVNACGFEDEPTINGLLAGCAQLPGHVFVEGSDFAELSPATLMGHELGHNLDLLHLGADIRFERLGKHSVEGSCRNGDDDVTAPDALVIPAGNIRRIGRVLHRAQQPIGACPCDEHGRLPPRCARRVSWAAWC